MTYEGGYTDYGLWKGFHCVCPHDAEECTCGAAEGNGPCSNPSGHEWAFSDTDRCYCLFCGADGDA